MIVWLASYPRSGNTLLRTILFNTMGLKSVSDEAGEAHAFGLTEFTRRHTGIVEIEGAWNDFYQSASRSDQVFLVKTHRAPLDDQAAIYVVRDGRRACLSYSRFHEHFTPSPHPGLFDLVLGNDYYGGWSEHYRAWARRENTWIVRYEDLINANDTLLATLAQKVGYSERFLSWVNPFERLHEENPEFFRSGERLWQGDVTWTKMIDAVFCHRHGDLMVELGYTSSEEVSRARGHIPEGWMDLVDAAARLAEDKRLLQKICDDRQNVIAELKQECDKRLQLIDTLVATKNRWVQ